MSTFARKIVIDRVAREGLAVKLSDPLNQYGIKRNDNNAIVVGNNVAMEEVGGGVYRYVLNDPAPGISYTGWLEFSFGGEEYHYSGIWDADAAPIEASPILLDTLGAPSSADKVSIIYPPNSAFLEQGSGHPYVGLHYENERRINVLLERRPDRSYSQYQIFGGVTGSADWKSVTFDADGRALVQAVLTEKAVLVSTVAAPFALWDGATFTVSTLDATGVYLTDTCVFRAGDFANIGAATVNEVVAAITAQCPRVVAQVVAENGLKLSSISGNSILVLACNDDCLDVLGFEFDNRSTVYSKRLRGFGSQMKRIYVQYQTNDQVRSDVLSDWIVYDTSLPVLPKFIRNTMGFGIPLTRQDGMPIPDEDICEQILFATGQLEEFCQVFVMPTRIRANPDARQMRAEIDYDRAEPGYDYDYRDAKQWWITKLRSFPVISVDKVELVYYTGAKVFEFPAGWFKLFPRTGQLQITPTGGDLSKFTLALGSQYLPLTAPFQTRRVPQYIWIDYTAGYKPEELPQSMREAIAKLATINVFTVAGDAKYFGLTSLNIADGAVSENLSMTRGGATSLLGSRIEQYKKDLQQFVQWWRNTHKGVVATFI